MNSKILKNVVSICLLLLASVSTSHAASGTWTGGGGDAPWADVNNWSTGVAPGSGDTATFNGAGNGVASVDFGTGVTVSNITFDTASAAAYTFFSSASGALSLNDFGGVTMTPTVANSQIFNAQILLGTATAATYTFTNASAGSTLTLAGNVQGGIGGTGATKTLVLGGNILVSGAIGNGAAGGSEAVGLQQTGVGTTLTLTATNTFTGPISGIAGTLTLSGAALLQGGSSPAPYAGTIANNGTFNYSSSSIQTNNGLMSGTGALVVNGPGKLALGASPSTYSGLTTINGGVLQINSASGGNGFAQNSVIIINGGGELDLNASDCLGYSLSLPITNSGVIKKLASQSETLGRPIYMSGGSLVTTLTNIEQFETFGNFIATLPNTANFVTGPGKFGLRTATCYISNAANSTFTFSSTVDQNAAGAPLNKTGPGSIILNGTNTYTGNTIISNGVITIGGSGSLGSGNYSGIISNYATLNYGSSANQVLAGSMTGSGVLTVSGPGTLILAGSNNYTGLTTVTGGKFVVFSSQPNTSPVTVNDGGTLGVYAAQSGSFSPSTLTLGSSAGATLQLAVSSTTQAPLTPVILNLTGNNTISISGSIAPGTYPLMTYTTLQGAGTLNIASPVLPNGVVGSVSFNSGNNTYYLTVTSVASTYWDSAVNGTWDINTTGNWVAPNSGNTYLDGSVVQFDDAHNAGGLYAITNAGAITLTPSTVAVANSSGNYSFSSNIVITGAGGLTKSGTGNLTNSGLDSYTGPTVINQGAIIAGAASAGAGPFGLNSAVSLANVAGAAMNLNNFSQQIGSLSGGGTTGGNVILGSGSLTVGNDNSSQTYAGVISGTGGLNQTGTGTLTLTGVNTFTGAISGITGGLTLGGAGSLNNGTYAGAITDNGNFNYNSSAIQTNSGVMSGTGALTVNGPGTLILVNSGSTYSGLTTVNGGKLVFQGSTGGTGNVRNSTIIINPGGELDLNTNDALGYSVALPVTNYGIIKKINSQAETLFRPIYLSGGSLVTTIGGAGQFESFGNFIATLPNTVNAISGPGNFGLRTASCYMNIAANSVLNISAVIYPYTAGTPLNLYGTGTVNLSAANTFSGGISNTATVVLTNGGSLGSGTFAHNVTNNGAFVDGSTAAQSVTAAISGSGSVQVTASGAALTLTAANTYTGPTIVAGGDLLLSGTGSISNTPTITVSNGATFDVSGLATPFALGASQTLSANGIVNGAFTTTAGSKIFPGTDGSGGTVTFNNGLTLASGAAIGMDVTTTYNGTNDQIIVSGALTLNGNALHLKAPSLSALLDSSGNDYVLISAPGGISGSFASAPVFDVAPVNAGNFSIVTDTTLNQVRLHYAATSAPIVSGTATPPTGAVRNQNVLISATVTPGTGSVTNVTLDLTPFGGSPTFPLVLSSVANVYTNTITVPASAAVGSQTLVATATDTTPLSGSGNITFSIVATTEKWDGLGSSENWDANANWLSGLAPGLTGDALIFAGTTGLAPVMDNNYAVNGLTFDNTAGAFNVAAAGTTLTINGGSGVTNNSASVETLQTPVALGGAVTLNAASGNLVLGQPVSETVPGTGVLTAAGTNTNTLLGVNTYTGTTIVNSNSTLLIGGAGQLDNGIYPQSMTVNGTFNYGSSAVQTNIGLIFGAGGLTVSGTGTLALGASPSSYAGPTIVSNGILQINSASGGNGFASNSTYLLIGPSGEVDLNVSDATGYALTNPITNYGVIKKIASQAETLFRPLYMAGGSLVTTVSGQIQFESFGNFIQTLPNTTNYVTGPGRFGLRTTTCYIGVANNSVFSFAGVPIAQDANGTTSSGLNFGGPGTLMLSGVNTYVGPTIISNNGTLLLADPGQLGGGSYGNTIADGGAFIDSSTAGQTLSGVISGAGSLQVNGNGSSATLTLTAAETYSGTTTVVSNGNLTLGTGASINNSASIFVGSGATLDVSALSSFSLNGSQTLSGSGTINGVVATTPDSIIYPGTDGTYGTLTFQTGLNLSSGATLNFDLGTLTTGDGGTDDQINLNGNLTLNGNSIHIKAPSASSSLDTSDYVLLTVNGTISGSFASTPVWDVKPVNAFDYTVQTVGNTVLLHYSQFTAPGGTGSATPAVNVLRNQTILLSVTVTNHSSPIVSVTVDASPLGGSVVALVQQGSSSVYTNSVTIPAATGPGPETLTATITDSNSLVGTAAINFNVVTSTEKWTGTGPDANWGDNLNWLSGAAPGYVGDSLVFSGTADLAPSMDQNYTVGGLGFGGSAGAFDIGTPGSTLTVNIGITNNSPNTETLNVPVTLSGPVTLSPTAGNLVLAQPLSGTGGLNKVGADTATLMGANTYTGATTLSGGTLDFDSPSDQVLTGLISGTGSLTMDGTGNLTLTNSETYSGGTIVNNGDLILPLGGGTGTIRGVLTINAPGQVSLTVRDAIGYTAGVCVSNVIINGGTLDMVNNAGFITAVQMTGGAISDNSGTGALFNFYDGYNLSTSASANGALVSAGLDIRGTNLVITTDLGTVPGGADLTVSGIINNSNNNYSTTTGALTKAGPGTAVFSDYNTYPGGTTVAGGTLQVDAGENPGLNGPLGTGPITFADGTLQYSDQNQFDYSSRFTASTVGQPVSIDTSNQSVTFSTGLAGAGGLTKLGLGTLTLDAVNTYSGNTTISAGALALTSGASISSVSSLGIAGGAFFDVSSLNNYTLGSGASLTASGSIANPAAINASSGESVSLGSSPIILNYDGAGPSLTISNGILSLNGNAFTVNGSPLAVGSYVVVTQTVGNISSAGSYTVNGTAIGAASQGSIAVNSGQVILTIQASTVFTPSNIVYSVTGNSLKISWPSSYQGWYLQSNSISLAHTNDWFDISGSASGTNATIIINKTGPATFFRLQAP